MVDRLEEKFPLWKQEFRLHTLVINADNGQESNGCCTQWLKRLVALSDAHQLNISWPTTLRTTANTIRCNGYVAC